MAFVEAPRRQDLLVSLPIPLQRPAVGAAPEELVDANLVREHVPEVIDQERDVHNLDKVGAIVLVRGFVGELVQDD